MPKQRKNYSSDLKARVALEAIKGQKTANEIAAEYAVHPTQIAQWKKQAMDGLPDLFSTRRSDQAKSEGSPCQQSLSTNRPTESSGGLVGKKIKSTPLRSNEASSSLEHPQLSIAQQCELLGLPVKLLL